jgi:hypothetical protein
VLVEQLATLRDLGAEVHDVSVAVFSENYSRIRSILCGRELDVLTSVLPGLRLSKILVRLARSLNPRVSCVSSVSDSNSSDCLSRLFTKGRYCASWFCSTLSPIIYVMDMGRGVDVVDMRSDRLAFRYKTERMRILNAIRSDGRCYSCGNLRDILRQ